MTTFRQYSASGAIFNDAGTHRYALWRHWLSPLLVAAQKQVDSMLGSVDVSEYGIHFARILAGLPQARSVLWIMLNPSTADAEKLDPTLRRCESFSRRFGFDGMYVANIVGLRSTDPDRLYESDVEPVGSENDLWIRALMGEVDTVIVGWGKHGKYVGRADAVRGFLNAKKTYCLGVNGDGSPKHPLYLPDTTALQPFQP